LPYTEVVPFDVDHFGPKGWKLVIHAYFDDSGKESDPDNRIVCIAGYLAAEHHWNFFLEEWGHQLIRHGLKWLHTTDFMADAGEYETLKWDWPRKRAVLESFIKTIKDAQLIGFGVSVDADAWRKIPKEVTDREGDAQQFCFMRIMRMIVERMKIARPRDFISVMFDCDRGFTPARFRRFLGVRDKDPEALLYFQSFGIAEPKVYLPLQAADLLAWQTRKELMRRLGGYESRPEFKFLFEATPVHDPDYAGEYWDEKEIEEQILKPIRLAQSLRETGEVNDRTI
jgi:hypothetical protein